MKNKKQILTAVVVAGSLGVGAQALFAQTSRPIENPVSEGQYEGKGSAGAQQGTQGRGGISGGVNQDVDVGVRAQGKSPTGTSDRERGSRPIENSVSESQYEEKGALTLSPTDVQKVKAALRQKGLNPGPMNGDLDAQTQQALREFQQKNNLRVTGTIDDQTAAKLGVTINASGSTRGSTGTRSNSGTSGSMERSGSGSSNSR